MHERHRKFAGTLVVALPASHYVFDTLRPLESLFSWPKLLPAALCTLGPVMGSRWWQRRRGLKPAAEAHGEVSIPSAPVNHALAGALACEASLVRHLDMPMGSSLFLLAQKRG